MGEEREGGERSIGRAVGDTEEAGREASVSVRVECRAMARALAGMEAALAGGASRLADVIERGTWLRGGRLIAEPHGRGGRKQAQALAYDGQAA